MITRALFHVASVSETGKQRTETVSLLRQGREAARNASPARYKQFTRLQIKKVAIL